MPRKSKINPEELFNIIQNYDVFHNDSKHLKGPAQECWSLIQKDLNHVIDAKYIYTIVLQNRYGIADKIKINKQNILSKISDDSKNIITNVEESSDESQSNSTTLEVEHIFEVLKFNITLSPEEWKSIYNRDPKSSKCSDLKNSTRMYYTLIPYEWTPIINEHFFEQTKLACCVKYHRAKIYPEGELFLKIDGICKFCKSIFKGCITNEPNEKRRVVIQCTMEGSYLQCTTRNKRRIIGEKKEQFLNKMLKQNMSAAYVQRSEARETMEYGDPEPSHLPSLNALRVMKYKENKKNHLNEDPILAVLLMKGMYPYNNIIRDIGYDRLFVHYWAAQKVNSYRNYCKNNKIPTISIDATGGIVKSINLLSGRKTGHLFLYQIAVMDCIKKSQFAVAHMISERHDNNSITHWLTEWVRSGITTPKVVVLDQSLALMIAVVRTFTQYSSLGKYINVCSSLILNELGTEVPLCMVRNDFNHVMHLISTWPEIKSSTFRVNNFYLRSIGLIIVSTNFIDVKHLLKMIFTVVLHETEGNNIYNQYTQCEIAKIYLKQRIATHTTDYDQIIIDMDNLNDNTNVQEENVIINDIDNTIFDEIKCIYDLCVESANYESNSTGDRDNIQFCPKIAKHLLDFCKLMPCWSALMVPIFKYGNLTESSCTSESLFKDLKIVVFKHKQLPLRLDEFLKIHINCTLGSMNILADTTIQKKASNDEETNSTKRAINNISDEKNEYQPLYEFEVENEAVQNVKEPILSKHLPQKKISIDKSYNDPFALENWKGLGNQVGKKKRKGTYLDKDPTILYYNDTSRTKSKVIGLLKNGNISDLKSIKVDNKLYCLTNTCAFDSIFQIMCSSYVDSDVYAESLNTNGTDILFKLIINAVRDSITAQTYKKRAYILKPIISDYKQLNETPDGLTILDSACTANHMFQKLFEKYPSYIEVRECLTCSYIQTKLSITITANLPTESINFMQDVLKK